jgi:hypothetical protein
MRKSLAGHHTADQRRKHFRGPSAGITFTANNKEAGIQNPNLFIEGLFYSCIQKEDTLAQIPFNSLSEESAISLCHQLLENTSMTLGESNLWIKFVFYPKVMTCKVMLSCH